MTPQLALLLLVFAVTLHQVVQTAGDAKGSGAKASATSPALKQQISSNPASSKTSSITNPSDSLTSKAKPTPSPAAAASKSSSVPLVSADSFSSSSYVGTSGRLCPGTTFSIGGKEVRTFSELSRLFAQYTYIPKIGGRSVVAIDLLTAKPCGAFTGNATFYVRVGVRDMKQFKHVFQSQALRAGRSLFKGLPEPRYVLDLGARTGLTTAYLATNFPQAEVIATEPSLPEFSLLRLNTARYSNVHAEYGAVWDNPATLKLGRGSFGRADHLATSSTHRPLWHRFVVDVLEVASGGRLGDIVPAITINNLLQRYNWPSVDLLNADLEGVEKVVLGDPKARSTWMLKVRCIALRLAPDQTPTTVSRLLGQEFTRAGRTLDQYFWCRHDMGRSNSTTAM